MLKKKKIREERLVSIVHAFTAPQAFQGNLETTVILVCVAPPYLLIHVSRYIYMQPSSFNKPVLCANGKIGKSRMAVKDEQVMAIQHIYTARTYLFAMNLTICIRAPHSL